MDGGELSEVKGRRAAKRYFGLLDLATLNSTNFTDTDQK
jgi:hypothetical protein